MHGLGDLDGQVTLVAGGSRGLGLACVEALAGAAHGHAATDEHEPRLAVPGSTALVLGQVPAPISCG